MYLKRLEMFGFKSFADKTVLNFEAGITAVVGPNGCGKSNVFDAVRWVLGEQSAKDLRGSSMTDVIFNGTEKKPSLGFAEVHLTFDNTDRAFAQVNEDEVIISRRLFRSGESEYLINKTGSRLKDIQEMLMGTGIGAEAYSLVQQGRVDLVVSAKPEDRRIILDEAAGITKYKAKKKEAMNKLKDAENNLLRINDITIEVKRQIASIDRQANKARRFKEEFEKLKDLEIKYARYELKNFDKEHQAILSQIEELKEKETVHNREHDELADRLTNEINYLDELQEKVNELNAQQIKLDGEVNLHNRQIEFDQERISTLQQSRTRLIEQKEQLNGRCKTQQEKIETVKQQLIDVEYALNSNQQKLTASKEALHHLEKTIRDAKESIKANEEKILAFTSRQIGLRNALTDVMKEYQGSLARKRRLELENEKVIGEKQGIDTKWQNVNYQLSCVQGTLGELEISKAGKLGVIEGLAAGLKSLDDQIIDLDKNRVFLESQKEFIEKLNTQYQDIPDPQVLGRLITDNPPQEHHTGIVGKVKEFRPLENVNISAEDQKQLYEVLCEIKFIELDIVHFSLKIEQIVEEINQKRQEREQLSSRVKEEEESLNFLAKDIQDKEKVFSILQAQQKDISVETAKLQGEIDLVGVELTDVQISIETLKKKEDALNFDLDTVNKDLSWCQHEIKDRQEAISIKSHEKEELSVQLAQLETEVSAYQEKAQALEHNKTMFVGELDHSLDELKRVNDELVGCDVKEAEYIKEIEELNNKIVEITSEKESVASSAREYENQRAEMSQKINSLRSQMTALESEVDTIHQAVHECEMKAQKLVFDVQTIKERVNQAYKIDVDQLVAEPAPAAPTVEQPVAATEETPATEIVAEAPVEISGNATLEEIIALLPKEEIPVVETAAASQMEVFNVDEARIEIDRLRKRCDSYGNVNLAAMDEYEELKTRFEFLTKQQSDLLEAKSQLMNTITKINRSTRQMFLDTFTKVGEEFRIYFRMLFGGGEAQLVLLDPENVLESGIDIIARPPGKKLQNISLMSGGEKTLTAIALIFGVFKVNPSPFCVLDEIDAALDESNVGRFSYLLKDFAKIAQFIVITHNKKTISAADVMYGITMPETGVSRVVSVRLSEDKKEKVEETEVAGV